MDNRRVAKVYRDKSQRVRKLPFAPPAGLLSKVKRYFSTGGLPSRIASFSGGSNTPQNPPKEPESQPKRDYSFVLPDTFASANNTTVVAGSEDSNRILSSFFQEKGNTPLSQVEYEGVMSLLDRSKASVTLPLPDVTPDRKSARNSAANAPENASFANYSQKMLRNTSGYDVANASSSSLVPADYRPAYHTFSDVSRGSISMKRVYPLSNTSTYRKRIKAPDFSARRARRVVSAAPSVPSADKSVADVASGEVFRPKSKTANSLLSILDGNGPAQESAETGPETEKKSLHNPYARPKRFTPLQKEPIFENPSPNKAENKAEDKVENKFENKVENKAESKADEISKTLAFNKAEELKQAAKDGIDSLFGNSGKVAETKEVTGSENSNQAASVSETPRNAFGLPETSLNDKTDLFGTSTSDSVPETSTTKPLESVSSVVGEASDKPAFSFGKKIGEEPAKIGTSLFSEPATQNKPFSFGQGTTQNSASAGFSFGSSTASKKSTGDIETPQEDNKEAEKPKPSFSFSSNSEAAPKPAFTFGAKESSEKPAFSFGANSSVSKPVDAERSANVPKPSFTFGAKKIEELDSHVTDNDGTSKVVETIDVDSGSDDGETEPKSTPFTFGSKPEKSTGSSLFGSQPALNFGAAKETEKAEKKAERAPKFSFGVKPTAEQEQSIKPAFSLESQTPQESTQVNFGFGSKPVEAEKPAFSFGAAKPSERPASAFSFAPKTSEEKKVDQPAFSFGNPPKKASTFKFGAAAENSDRKAEKPAFTFGTNSSIEKNSASAEPKIAEPVSDKQELFEDKPASLFGVGSKPAEPKITPAFTFGSKMTTEKSEAEKPAFSFGSKTPVSTRNNEKPATIAEDVSKAKPAFSFGSQSATPSFSFGSKTVEPKPTEPKPIFSFGSKPAEPKPAFSFGSKPAEAKNAEPKPAFSFGAKAADSKQTVPTPAFSFGAKPAEEKVTEEKPAQEKSSSVKPAFNLGSQVSQTPSLEKKEAVKSADQSSVPKPIFDFGAKPLEQEKTSGSSANPFGNNPAFSFGKPASDKTPAFSFGSKPAADAAPSETASLTVGSKTSAVDEKETAESKPAFEFGKNSSTIVGGKPSFNFGAKVTGNENNAESKEKAPTFNFGAKPAEANSTEKPASLFGSSANNPFSFGSTSNKESSNGSAGFSFGSKPDEKNSDHETSVTEKNGNGKDEPKPAFQFGVPPSTSSKPFSFGAKSAEAKPAFSFGSASSNPNGSQTTNGNGSNGEGTKEQNLEHEFVFPEVPLIEANVNEEDVKKYESLFQF